MLLRSLALALTLCTSLTAAAVDLKGWVLESSEYPNYKGLSYFFEKLNEQSKGKYTGKVLWRDDLGNQKAILPKFKKGELDMAVISNAGLAEVLPEMEVMSLPFLFRNPKHMLEVLDGDIGDSLKRSLANKGYIVLAWYNGGSRSFYARTKVPQYATDFKGMKVRVANRATMIDMIKAIGAEPSTLDYNKVVDALKTGELDAAENDIISYYISEHYKTAPHYVFSHHNVLPEALVVSTQRWAALSEQEREQFQQAAFASAEYMRTQRALRENEVRALLQKGGVKFYEMQNTENFVARMKSTYAPVLLNQASTDLMFRIMTGH